MKRNVVGWFEIPVLNMERAIKFYETVLSIKLSRNKMGELDMAWFPGNGYNPGSSGSLVHHKDFYKPSKEGVLIYFSSATGNLADELSHVEKAGGEIIIQKKKISEDIDYMALITDSEGNRIALHSTK